MLCRSAEIKAVMRVQRIIINLHPKTTVATDFHGICKGIFLADGKEHLACVRFFLVGHALYCHGEELFLALYLVLFGKDSVAFIACDEFFIFLNGLWKIFQYPVLKVVMLGQIALLQYFQLCHLHIQVHFFFKAFIACGKHLDLRKGKSYLVHILGGTHGAFARHYLRDKFLLALHQLIEVCVKGLLRQPA